jgi:opacity protein-like surface antigen
MLKLRTVLLASNLFLSLAAFADSKGGSPTNNWLSKIFPHPTLSVSYGHDVNYITDPKIPGVEYDKGWDLHGGFDFSVLGPLHLSLGYFHHSFNGYVDFDYTEYNTGAHAHIGHVSVKNSASGPNLGLRLISSDNGFVHPYLEGGGFVGLYQVTYFELPSQIQGFQLKLSDFEPMSGFYGEGGLLFKILDKLSIGAGYRYTAFRTGKMVTLGNQELDLKSGSYFLTLGIVQ